MKIIIVGNGKLGSTLAEQLIEEDHELTIIDTKSDVLESAVSSKDVQIVQGNGASYEIQMEAGVPRADLLIAVTNSDELNMLSCIMAKKLGVKYTIARVRNPEYSRQSQILRDELGLSMVINPDRSTAAEIVRNLRYSSAINLELFARGRTELIQLRVDADSPFAGKTLYQIGASTKTHFLICAVQRGDEVFIPTGNFRLEGGDFI
ncbi:MAG: NAD-binding protein, partial [Oscillospiraceae bacterium]|nr:NAD-binding protein [Oscillospiraceae bacterium]